MNVFTRENAVIATFVALAIVGFYGALELTDDFMIAVGTALLLGVIAPSVVLYEVL